GDRAGYAAGGPHAGGSRNGRVRRARSASAPHPGDLLMSTPMALSAGDAAAAVDREALAYFAGKRREKWRRRILPAAGLIGLIVVWWALVAGFDVKPFIAPSPALVLETMVNRWSVLWHNLIPTAIEAFGGFML